MWHHGKWGGEGMRHVASREVGWGGHAHFVLRRALVVEMPLVPATWHQGKYGEEGMPRGTTGKVERGRAPAVEVPLVLPDVLPRLLAAMVDDAV